MNIPLKNENRVDARLSNPVKNLTKRTANFIAIFTRQLTIANGLDLACFMVLAWAALLKFGGLQ